MIALVGGAGVWVFDVNIADMGLERGREQEWYICI